MSSYSLDPNPFLKLRDSEKEKRKRKKWTRRQGGVGLSKRWSRPKLRAPVERSIKNMRQKILKESDVKKDTIRLPLAITE